MVFNMVFQLLLVGSLAAIFYIFMRGLVQINDVMASKCVAMTSSYGGSINDKQSEGNQILCNLPTGLVGVYLLLLVTFVIVCILKPFNLSKRIFSIISVGFGLLYFFMLCTGIAFFVSTLVSSAADSASKADFRSDFL